jgi:hypothetical protein
MSSVRELIQATGRDRRDLARMLGYGSENSLRQAESGKQALPVAKLRWLTRYAKLRERHAKAEAEWLEKNPAPNEKSS